MNNDPFVLTTDIEQPLFTVYSYQHTETSYPLQVPGLYAPHSVDEPSGLGIAMLAVFALLKRRYL